jgi:flagellin
MALSILNNIPSLVAQNQLSSTQSNLQKTLFELASGSRINSGADDAAGLSIANGLNANIMALNQSQLNANDGVGQMQVTDGALSQVTTLLNRAVTLATEAGTGTVNSTQRVALDTEFTAIKAEISRIGADTTFNNTSVFANTATSIFLSDGNSAASSSITVQIGVLAASNIGTVSALSSDSLLTDTAAQTALSDINTAIAQVAALRGQVGASMNRLQAAGNVMATQVQNLTSAEDGITSANIAATVADMSKYNILNQTGIAALSQANTSQQSVLSLLR